MNPIDTILTSLTSNYRKVLKYLFKLYKKYKGLIFVLGNTLAEWCRCCKRTIIRAINKFIELGFIIKIERKRQCNRYIFNEEFVKQFLEYETSLKPDFHSRNVTSMSPIYSKGEGNKYSMSKPPEKDRIQRYKEREKHEFTEKDRIDLQKEFSEYVFEEARQVYNWSVVEKKLIEPNTVYGYFRHLCKKIKNKVIK